MGYQKNTIGIAILGALAYSASDVLVKIVSTITPSDPYFQFRSFAKPLTLSILVFIGTFLVYMINKPKCPNKITIKTLLPGLMMGLSAIMFNAALVHGNSPVVYLIRHSLLIFAPLASIKERPRGYQLLAAAIIGISLITSVYAHGEGIWAPLLSIGSMMFTIIQIYTEIKIIQDADIDETGIIAAEGFWAALVSMIIFSPLAYALPGPDVSEIPGGAAENLIDSLKMIFSSAKVLLGIILVLFTSFLNSSSMILLSGNRNGMIFVVSDILVTFLAWLVLITTDVGGDGIASSSGLCQIVSLVLYSVASLIYNQVLKLPWFSYSDWAPLEREEEEPEFLLL